MIEELAADAKGTPGAKLSAGRELVAGAELVAATDVEHPLLTPMGAAAVFGPQKGADRDTVRILGSGWPPGRSNSTMRRSRDQRPRSGGRHTPDPRAGACGP